MKTKLLLFSFLIAGILAFKPASAEEQSRDVSIFSQISLRISGKVYLKQGEPQSVRVVAKESVIDDIITEVKGDELTIRFPNKTLFQRKFNPGKVEIYITVPDVNGLAVSGSGDIVCKNLDARILNLAVSGSGSIEIDKLESKKVKGAISGSGNVRLNDGGLAEELTVAISGSGNFDASGFEAEDINVSTSGSGNCKVYSNGSIEARIAGSGSVLYDGNASIDASVAGSGKVKQM